MVKYIKSNLTSDEHSSLVDAFLNLYGGNDSAYNLAIAIVKFLSIDEFESFMHADFYDIYEEVMYPEEFEE